MEFPILFKKTDNNKTQFWKIYITEESPEKAEIFTEYGLTDGKITKPSPQTILKSGNKTALERAKQPAQTKWKNKKITNGYQEQEMPNKFIKFQPMKPVDWEKFSHSMKYPAYLQPKLDGVRMFAFLDENGDLQTLSRQSKPIENIEHLRTILELIFAQNPDLVLDGELMIHKDYQQKELRGLLAKKYLEPEDEEKLKTISYNVFDVVERNNLDMTFVDRWREAEKIAKKWKEINIVPTKEVKSKEEVNKNFNDLVELGFEGAIIRNKDGIYRMGKQSQDVQKIKLYFVDEFEIMGFHEGTGDDKGTVIWEVKCLKNPKRTFRVKPMGSRELKRKWFENGEKYIGMRMLVYFYEKDEDGCVVRIKTGEMKK